MLLEQCHEQCQDGWDKKRRTMTVFWVESDPAGEARVNVG